MWAFSSEVMMSEIMWTLCRVTPGSQKSNSSFGSRPTLCMTAAFLLSLLGYDEGNRNSTDINHNLFPQTENLIQQSIQASSPLLSLPDWFCWTFPWLFSAVLWYWWQASLCIDRTANKSCQFRTRSSLLFYMICWLWQLTVNLNMSRPSSYRIKNTSLQDLHHQLNNARSWQSLKNSFQCEGKHDLIVILISCWPSHNANSKSILPRMSCTTNFNLAHIIPAFEDSTIVKSSQHQCLSL